MAKRLYGTNKDGTKVNYKDLPVREAITEFVLQMFGWEVESNSNNKFEIDLVSVNGECPDIECERGNWDGNYWDTKFSEVLKYGSPRIPFKTINFQQRKEHYWIEGNHYFPESGNFRYTEKNHLTNIFIRTEFNFNQMILVRPNVIRDKSKINYSMKKTFNISNGDVEPWCGFRREDSETYNKVNGVWVLEEVIKPIELETV
jgi:hypothetical protein